MAGAVPRLSDERPSQERDLAGDRIKEVELWDLVSASRGFCDAASSSRRQTSAMTKFPWPSTWRRSASASVREGRVAFSAFFEGEAKRNVIVGLFLAILELLRHHGFRAEQAADYGEIWIRPPINDAGGPLVPSAEEPTLSPEDRR